MIKEKELPKAVVNNKLITHKATDLTIMSYDKNVHKLIIPTDLTQDQISDIIVLITFRYHENIIQISGELVEDKIEIILPNEIRSLSGEFYIEIDINLTDNRQITFARYRANVVKSDIDSVDLDDAQEFYFELFDDFVQKVADKSDIAVAEIDAQVAQAQDSLQEVSDTLTAVNDKVATVNDTADNFMADVATKQSDVTSKYNAFDTSVTQANQKITDILALQGDVQQIGVELNKKANKTQEEWITPTLLNGVTNYASGISPVRYYKNEFNTVCLDGISSAVAAGTHIFILPVGYRPLKRLYVPTVVGNHFGWLEIGTDGSVKLGLQSPYNIYISFGGIMFRAEG